MKFRILVLLILILGMMVPMVGAQDTSCFNLSAEDCAIVTNADASMSDNVDSANISLAIDFSMTGVPDAGDVTFNLSGKGPMVFVPDSEIPVNMQMAMDMAANTPDGPEAVAFEFIIIDNAFYMLDPSGSGQWLRIDLLEAMANSGAPLSPDMLTGGVGNVEGLGEMTEALEGLATIPGFIDYVRLGDEEMMGQTMYPFSLTMDFTKLISDAQFSTILQQVAQSAGPDAAQLPMIGAILPMLVQEGTINVTQWIGADDSFTHRMTMDLNATIDASAFEASLTEPIVVVFHFDIGFSDFNGDFPITAPADAIDIPMSGGFPFG